MHTKYEVSTSNGSKVIANVFFLFFTFLFDPFSNMSMLHKNIYKVYDRFDYKIIIFSIIAVIVAEVLCL